jgi:hypothetical protein
VFISYVSLVISDLLVNVVVAEDLIDSSQDTRNVVMDIDDLDLLIMASTSLKIRLTLAWLGSSSVKNRRLISGRFTDPRVIP